MAIKRQNPASKYMPIRYASCQSEYDDKMDSTVSLAWFGGSSPSFIQPSLFTNTKIEAVKEYQAGFSGEKIIEKYDIRSLSQLKQWSTQYNNDELKTKSRKRVRKSATARKNNNSTKRIIYWNGNLFR